MYKEIVIIGTGNVAFHFAKTLSKENFNLSIISRNKREAELFEKLFACQILKSYTAINTHALVIVCVPDEALKEVITNIPTTIKTVCTSGMLDLDVLGKRDFLGILYPLQTFSKLKKVKFLTIPFFIEASSDSFRNELCEFANTFSNHVHIVSPEKRKQIHLAAVFCNNFTNHLVSIAKNQLEAHEINFSLMYPLLRETFDKMKKIGPANAQTGPAKRNDLSTIQQHLNLLDSKTKSIYISLTNSILEENGFEKL